MKLFRDNVTLSDLWVSSNDRLSDFYASSWQRGESAVPLLVLRLLLTAVTFSVFVWSLVEAPSPFWLIYLTNWGLLLVTLMMFSGLFVSIMAVCGKVDDDERDGAVPWYIGLYWFTFNIAVSIAIMITALYWILLFDPSLHDDPRMFWFDVATHGVNSCVAVTELVASRTPLRILHLYMPTGMGLWYAAFTAIYYAAGGTDANGNPFIYEVLDWRYGKRAGTIVAISFAGLLGIYTALWLLAQARDRTSAALVRTISHDLAHTPPDNFLHSRMA